MTEFARSPLADQPWFTEFLAEHGFQRRAADRFTNGRATIRLEGSVLYAIPGDGSKAWRTELNGTAPEAARQLLTVVLAAPSFLAPAALEQRVQRQRAAGEALQNIAASIREHPDTHSGQHLRRFLWSLFNGHHDLNLWRLKGVLDGPHNGWVTEAFTAWMQGHVSEDSLRHALEHSGEMERWDTVRPGLPEQRRLAELSATVTELLHATAPGRAMTHLSHANALLGELADALRQAATD